jgi:hypothetical protein
MKAISRWLDRFGYNHPNFGVPNLITYLVAGNVIVFVLDLFFGGQASAMLDLDAGALVYGLQLWRLVSFVFVPAGMRPFWFVIYIMFTYFLGTTMEHEWGSAKLSLFYLFGSLLTILASFVTFFLLGGISASGGGLSQVHYTLFLAFATLYPDAPLRVYFIFPIRAKWLAAFYVFLEVWGIIYTPSYLFSLTLAIALPPMLAAWLNYLLFFWSEVTSFFRRTFQRTKRARDPQIINFRKAQKQARERRGYLHKCAVCGVTDADKPDMEFRYCSKCNGYYCYCAEHLNNHAHVK